MTPDASVQWNGYELPHGNLYVGSDASEIVVHNTLAFARGDWQAVKGAAAPLGYGNTGTVLRIGDIAYKRVHPEEEIGLVYDTAEARANAFGLPAVRAAVTFQEGLRRLQAKTSPRRNELTYSAPTMFACFIRPGAESPQASTTWAMSYERGVHQRWYHRGTPPPRELIEPYFDEAISLCGAPPGAVYYDIGMYNWLVRANTLLKLKHLVKLDVQAQGSAFQFE